MAEGKGHLLWRARTSCALVGVAVAIGVAGCGGSSKSASVTASAAATPAAATTASSTATAPAAQSIALSPMAKAAEGICERYNAKLGAEPKTLKGFGAIPDAFSRRARVENAALIKLVKLKPPAVVARAWAQIIGYRLALERNLANLAHKARRNEFNSMQAVYASNAAAERELRTVGHGAGFEHCSQVG